LSSTPPSSRARRPILIVDDDIDHRLACRELLEDNGYVVQEAGDGKKALARLVDPAQVEPCMVLLDLSMPLMDGWQLLAIMKSYLRLHEIPVVLISAQEPLLDPVQHGTIAAYLRKPHDMDDLLALAAKFSC
jgi:CheY-like chemotaxis protein